MRLRLSQSQLTLLDYCPRKFQHMHLDQLVLPMTPEQRSHLQWGNQFHLLMQQQSLGLPMPPADETLRPIHACVATFREMVPHLFLSTPERTQDSEHRRMLTLQDYLLTVVYDALILEPDRAEILDWKTYAKPQNPRGLEASWQTRLYLFVLAETTAYTPDQLSMTYWFIPPHLTDAPPPHITIRYSPAQHQVTHHDLSRLLAQLTQWLEGYHAGHPFPQVPSHSPHCSTCPFAIRCQRTPADSERDRPSIPAVESIAEVAL